VFFFSLSLSRVGHVDVLLLLFFYQTVLGLACIVDFFTKFDLARWRVNVVNSELCEGGIDFFWV